MSNIVEGGMFIIIKTWNARNNSNITLEELSRLTGISVTTLNRIENGVVDPRIGQLEKIAKALNVKISDLYESPYK
ncbi:helix-turn-helix domain-containing protein [Coprobacillus cateniformis]|uniref:helix-turn-helix domain-containing protein n=2 Tax=Coprobacillus cateniformis TaxID=100884 RepID=UPI0039A00B7E